jgi:glycosyltransferase involved in cell wall biosynthesis
MPIFWILFVGLLVLLFLYGDAAVSGGVKITPEKAAAVKYSTWQRWSTVEPADGRIRVLWIDQDYVPWVNAGSEICSHQINKFLINKPYKWDIYVATPGYPQRTYENVRCFNLYDTNKLLEVLSTTNILMSHSYVYRSPCEYISRVTGIPFVGWPHTDNYVKAVLRDRKQWHSPRCEGRQFSAFNSQSLFKLAKIEKTNCRIFIPVVDYRDYAVDPKKREPKYVTLSNVNGNKGGDLLKLLALACPDMEFLGVKGGYGKQVVDETIPNLTYISHTDKIKEIYAKTWVQIMPSKAETWGRTAVEAMSSGIPVVVSPTPGLRECCGEAALYVSRDDPEGWVTTLRSLKDNQEFYNKRSKKALERARALDPRPVLAQIEDWLENTVAPAQRPGRPLTAVEKNLLFR